MKQIPYLIGLVFLFACLIGIRAFEETLFYDPLIQFFKSDHSTSILPELEQTKLFLNLVFRYILNTVISLLILRLLFKSVEVVKLAAIVYAIFFVLSFISFVWLFNSSEGTQHLALFYVRRFLIHPLLLLLLIPAFYFQKKA